MHTLCRSPRKEEIQMNPMFKKPKAAKVEFSLSQIQGNPATRKQLEGFIAEIVLCKNKIKSESEAVGDIRKEAKDSLGIPPKILMKLVRESMSAGSIEAELQDLETVKAISEVIDGTTP